MPLINYPNGRYRVTSFKQRGGLTVKTSTVVDRTDSAMTVEGFVAGGNDAVTCVEVNPEDGP